jgi:hypothetical protein
VTTEHEDRLTRCNRKLVEDLNYAATRLAAAQRLADAVREANPTGGPIFEALKAWEATA